MVKRPKFKLGQIVSVRSFYGNWKPGQVGPGYSGKSGWLHGWLFGKIVKIMLPHIPPMKTTAPICYFLDGWPSAMSEDAMRPVTASEIGPRPKKVKR